MPTTFPAPAAPRRRPCGILRTAAMLALLLLGRLLFSAAMRIADFTDAFVRRD